MIFSFNVFAAGEDIFALGDRIIRDVYNRIAGISTVLAALMSAVAVIGAKMSGIRATRLTTAQGGLLLCWRREV